MMTSKDLVAAGDLVTLETVLRRSEPQDINQTHSGETALSVACRFVFIYFVMVCDGVCDGVCVCAYMCVMVCDGV